MLKHRLFVKIQPRYLGLKQFLSVKLTQNTPQQQEEIKKKPKGK